jgi:uncharacterized protein (DUF2336 family)
MIVRQFLTWIRTASAGSRADATSALARAYLYSDLSPDDLAAAEGAMIMLLDDPSPLVRLALAESLAASPDAPPAVILALASDQPEIATVVLQRSPLFLDADLVDTVGSGNAPRQAAIAAREYLPCAVAAAIAEVGTAEACLILIENPDALIAPFSLDRIIERFGHLAAIRESLLSRDDLPAAARQILVVKLSQALTGFVTARHWLDEARAARITQEACEKATVTLAAETAESDCARAVSLHRGSSFARFCREISSCSKRRWRNCPVFRWRGSRGSSTTVAGAACARCSRKRDFLYRPIRPCAPRSRRCGRPVITATSAARCGSSAAWWSAFSPTVRSSAKAISSRC